MIGTKAKILSVFLKCAVIISSAVGVILSAIAGAQSFMGGGRVFLLLRNQPVKNIWYLIKYVFTVSITLTGVVFCFVLAPTLRKHAWRLQHVLTHVVVPLAAVLDFFVTGRYSSMKKRSVYFVIIPPLLYAIYTGIAYAAKWEFSKGVHYPYFFLNWDSPAGAFGFTNELPYMGCAWWILLILVMLLAVGYGYLLALDLLKRSSRS